MSIILVGSDSGSAVDSSVDNALYVNRVEPAFGVLGAYSLVITTGAIAATLAASSNLFYLRWTNPTQYCLIEQVKVSAWVVSTITTSVPFDLALFYLGSFTANPAANTSAPTLTGRNCKRRTSMGTTLMATDINAGMAICTTAGMTGATVQVDANPMGRVSGTSGTVTGTQFFSTNPQILWAGRDAGDHPLLLRKDEGFVIQNPLAGPATGTFAISVALAWMEVASY